MSAVKQYLNYLNIPRKQYNGIVEKPLRDSTLERFEKIDNANPEMSQKAKDLIVGTHGRSVYKVSLKQVQELKKEVLDKTLYVYEIKNTTKSERWGSKRGAWGDEFIPKN